MTAAAKELELAFYETQIGTEHTLLVEKPQSREYSQGFTESYIPVRIYGEDIPRHTLARVKITGAQDNYCTGTTAFEGE